MTREKVLVLGGSFGGLTAALAVRGGGDITFPLASTFENHGVDFVHAEATALDPRSEGYIKVRDTYQVEPYDDVYAVGVAAAVPWQTAHAVGIPKTGLPTEQQAHVVARNIAAQVRGEAPQAHKAFGEFPPCASWTPATTACSPSPTRCCRPASTACSSLAPAPCHEARLREALHLDGPAWLRHPPLTRTDPDHGS